MAAMIQKKGNFRCCRILWVSLGVPPVSDKFYFYILAIMARYTCNFLFHFTAFFLACCLLSFKRKKVFHNFSFAWHFLRHLVWLQQNSKWTSKISKWCKSRLREIILIINVWCQREKRLSIYFCFLFWNLLASVNFCRINKNFLFTNNILHKST